MNPGTAQPDPLSALRPLHAPPPVSWWPPAPGWWILAGAVCLLIWWLVLRYLKDRLKRVALRELETAENNSALNDREFAAAISNILKRYALQRFPREKVASLSGKAWLEFLDATSPQKGFASGPGRALSRIYSPECKVDRKALVQLARQWIKTVRKRDF
jgi:hypothetical protein